MVQYVITPTRIHSLIDDMITHLENKILANGVIQCPDVSDHDLTAETINDYIIYVVS